MTQGKTIHELQVGDWAEFTKTVTETDICLYAGVSGDMNPAHINETYAAHSMFQSRIAHGMLPAGFISAVLGTKLPGPGTIYIKQDLSFKAPVRIGDTVTARAEVQDVNTEKKRATLKTTCTNQEGTVVIEGQALVMPPQGQ
ncbi:MAG: MaoC family dehydratase [Desulfovermiculus sp.]